MADYQRLSYFLHPHLHACRPQSEAGILDLERLFDAEEAIVPHHGSQYDLDLEHGEQSAYADPRAVGKYREGIGVLLVALQALPACRVDLVDVVTPDLRVEQGYRWADVKEGALWDGHTLNYDILAGCAVVGGCCDQSAAIRGRRY